MSHPTPFELARVDTLYSADSIEFCPHAPDQDLFVCGTYQLLPPTEPSSTSGESTNVTGHQVDECGQGDDGAPKSEANASEDVDEEDQVATPPAPRVGRLYLFSAADDAAIELQRFETPAILDAKWHRSAARLAVGDAKGGLSFYALGGGRRLELAQKLAVADEGTLVLSLDWAWSAGADTPSSADVDAAADDDTSGTEGEAEGGAHLAGPDAVICSLSNGKLALVRPAEGHMVVDSRWAAHDYEPWITAWDALDAHTVWSGGDDLALKRWDVRVPAAPTFTYRRFEGGVTALAPSPHDAHLLAVGSYDAELRIFDVRSPRQPLTTAPMPGGLWRTRWHPSAARRTDVLAACMYGGFRVVRLGLGLGVGSGVGGGALGEHEVVAQFDGHESLAYGADWCRRDQGQDSLVASCSFYDHAMCLWRA
ncbi:Diphthine methyltransferase [Cryptotrichosporon argae]